MLLCCSAISIDDPEDSSGILAWLYLFGLPSATHPLVQRDVDAAIRIAREGAHHSPPCGRCYALLGFLLGLGYPPLVGAVHLVQDGSGEPRLLILGDVTAHAPATEDAARLPRDVGPPDPAAAAYVLAYTAGDPLGTLVTAYLNRTGMVNLTLTEPGPNQASALVSRQPRTTAEAACNEALVNSLGTLAASTIDEIQAKSWGPVPDPLSQGASKKSADKAFLEHILADPPRSSASDLAKACSMLEAGSVRSEELPAVARQSANVSQLRALAASKGDRKSALRVAVEHLQENETEKAKPLLSSVVSAVSADASDEADIEMAKYYLERFVSSNASDVTDARRHAWQHLVKAADLGREDAKLLVAHALVDGSDAVEASNGSNSMEAIRRYRQLLPEPDKPNDTMPPPQRRHGVLTPVQAFAAYNLGVLSLQDGAALPEPRSSDSPELGLVGQNHTETTRNSTASSSGDSDRLPSDTLGADSGERASGICAADVSAPQILAFFCVEVAGGKQTVLN